jgi:TorA maturation chaperone TorD
MEKEKTATTVVEDAKVDGERYDAAKGDAKVCEPGAKVDGERRDAGKADAQAAAGKSGAMKADAQAAAGKGGARKGSDDGEMDLADLMRSRASTYGMLARLFRVEVDEEVLKELRGMKFPVATGNKLADTGYRQLYNYLRGAWADSVRELAVDYVRTFIGHGVNGYSAAYPYESVYTSERRLMMQEARSEVLQIMRDNHLKRGRWNEGEDHIGIEMEFMQRIALRTEDALRAGDEETATGHIKTQYDFARDHLLNWLPMLVSDMQQFSKTEFYKGLGNIALGFVQEDVDVLSELLESVGIDTNDAQREG